MLICPSNWKTEEGKSIVYLMNELRQVALESGQTPIPAGPARKLSKKRCKHVPKPRNIYGLFGWLVRFVAGS